MLFSCIKNSKYFSIGLILGGISLLAYSGVAMADDLTLGDIADNVTKTFYQIGKLITAGSYIAGLTFSVGSIMKFKQHKDNPTQITIGTPISLVLIASALLFLPTLFKTMGATIFGTATTAGSFGVEITGT